MDEFRAVNAPLIISNACISGVMAVNTAADYLLAGKYQHIVIIGIDVLSDFVINGFQSLFALSDEPCRPFDKDRKGISLGEACGVIVLSRQKSLLAARYCGGACSNDANHISGPSRTGEGLFRAIHKTLKRAEINVGAVQFINAHGTGTLYNDEMESIAFNRLAMNHLPVNSLKGYFGHTLGAAGIIEIIACLLSMEHQILFPSLGFKNQGTSVPLNILEATCMTEINVVLKTASGFGGGNAALVLMNQG
jgi:3-oxoacyl-[acyl-carrier-protein] synthase-1